MQTDYLLDIINAVKDADSCMVISVKGEKYHVFIDGEISDISRVILEDEDLSHEIKKHAYRRNLRTTRED